MTSFEADMCHGCEQTIDYGEGHRCTICPDYRLCEWCLEYDISTKPHSRSHALEKEKPILDISPPRRKKKVAPILSTCPACPRHIPHVSAECPLERESPTRESIQNEIPKYLPPHMRQGGEQKSVESTLGCMSAAAKLMIMDNHEKPLVPMPKGKDSTFYQQFDVCPSVWLKQKEEATTSPSS